MINSLISLSPILITACSAILAMLFIAVKRCKVLTLWIGLIGLALAFISLFYYEPITQAEFLFDFIFIDAFALFYMGAILISAFIVLLFAYAYFKNYRAQSEEFYVLILLATVGALLLVCANHFASFFLGLELLSVPTYGLLAYTREHNKSIDAGLKYLILSASASATLLFGMALVYAQFGTLQFDQIGLLLEKTYPLLNYTYLILGSAFILIAVAFKLSIAPFHQWAPDVYENAPTAVTLFLATIGKIAVFAVFMRFIFEIPVLDLSSSLFTILALLAILSMLVGNLFALKQKNYIRMLALSSVSHMGYAVIAVLCLDLASANLYLFTYLITSLAAFGVMTLIASPYAHAGERAALQGLFKHQPFLAVVLTVMLLSLAGIPLTLGFISKVVLVLSAATSGYWLLILALIIGSGVSLFYYLKAVILLYTGEPPKVDREPNCSVCRGVNKLILLGLLILVVGLGVYPDPILMLVNSAAI